MTTNELNPRSERGLYLAQAKQQRFVRIDENTWIVPSAKCSGHAYLVDVSRLTCTCPDSEENGAVCKHLWAVAYLQNEITMIDGTQLKPPPIVDAEHTATSLGVQGGDS